MKPYPKYLNWLRYACAWLLYFYGISKLTGHQLVTPAWVAQKPIGSLDGMTLTWYYFGYSHAFKYLLGGMQVVAASLLLFRKTSLLAALTMLPVMVNIVLINVFYWIAWGALSAALFILTALLLMLWHEREAFYHMLWISQPAEPRAAGRGPWMARTFVLLCALGMLVMSTVGFSAFQRKAESIQQQRSAAAPGAR